MKDTEHDINRIWQTKDDLNGQRVVMCIIARGGSVRLPRKNVKDFCGLPLVAWGIIQAQCSHLITDVYLSTDDDEIAEIGELYGAHIIRRSSEMAKLAASPSFVHALDHIEKRHPVDLFMTLLPTAPVRPPYEFDEGVALYKRLCDQGAKIRQLTPMVPRMETVIYEKVAEHAVEKAIWNKSWRYASGGGCWTVLTPAWYRESTQLSAKVAPTQFDSEVDYHYETDLRSDPNFHMYFYPIEMWQDIEVDIIEHWDVAGLMMTYYVLKDLGVDVYHRYGAQYG
jgi:hypothetical protein|tara:strand:- start:2949 stop:3794 length:846 start_codon:yes stop_codon:yes gene_type:complete